MAADLRAQPVGEFIDGLKLRGFALRVPILCVLLMVAEGLDAFGVGFVGPNLAKHLSLTPEDLGTIYAVSTVASLAGATLLTLFANRFGRRGLLVWTSTIMAPATALTALAPNFMSLLVLRFIIGMAFGAALPTAISLVADYAPKARRGILLMMLNAGISLGVVLAGYGAAAIIPAFGWQALLYASAGASFSVAILAWLLLPESLQHLIRRGRQAEALAIARRLDPDAPPAALTLDEAPVAGRAAGGVLALVDAERALNTALLWAMMALGYVAINYVSYWLPTTMMDAGASVQLAGVTISTGKFGGMALTFFTGWLADRIGLFRMLGGNQLVTASCIAVIAIVGGGPIAIAFMMLACALDSSNVSGGQAITAQAYPSELRVTAFGWISGLARLIGGGAGAIVGAHMVSGHWSVRTIALAFVALYVAMFGLLQLIGARRRRRPSPAAA